MKTQNTLSFKIAIATTYFFLAALVAGFVAIAFDICPAGMESFLK
jgi:hypothetical protein